MRLFFTTLCASTLLATAAFAGEHYPDAGDWMIRARALGVVPDESSDLSVAADAKIDNSVVPELDVTYFFTPNIAAEVIAAVTPHDVRTNTGVDGGGAWLLPPTLTLQYHFTTFDSWKPYVGAGINYTHFFNEDSSAALGKPEFDDTFGPALQVGVDIPVADNTYINIDVKKLFIHTNVAYSGGVNGDVDIDPWLMGVGMGYSF